jgi:aminobenzoyl-glutamate utilization protein B
MASTALDLIADPALIKAAKADHRARLDGNPFVNPIPDDVSPPLPENSNGR